MEGRTRGPGSRHSHPCLPSPGLSTPDCPPPSSTRAEQPLALQTCPPESSRPTAPRFLPEATALPAVTLYPPMPVLRTPFPPPPSPPRSSSLDQAQTHPSLHCLPGSCRHLTRGKPAELQGEPRPPASPHPILHTSSLGYTIHSSDSPRGARWPPKKPGRSFPTQPRGLSERLAAGSSPCSHALQPSCTSCLCARLGGLRPFEALLFLTSARKSSCTC